MTTTITDDQSRVLDALAKAKIDFYETLYEIGDISSGELEERTEKVLYALRSISDYKRCVRALSRV
jgi:hypothetical protein